MSNKVFTKSSEIKLDEKYNLTSDGDFGIVLTFSEPRTREETKKEGGKLIKTGKQEDYLFEDKFYFTRISQALTKYVDLTQNSSKTLEELTTKVDEIYAVIKKIDLEFQQF